MLTLDQIIKSAARVGPSPDGTDRFDRAAYVRVSSLKRGVSKKDGSLTFLAKTLTYFRDNRSGRLSHEQHVTSIDFPVYKGSQGSYVRLSCSCLDFCMRWEYNLHKKGAAEIRYCNGEAPKEYIPIGLCMHCIALASRLANDGYLNRDFTLRS